jgi:hypothetical protein
VELNKLCYMGQDGARSRVYLTSFATLVAGLIGGARLVKEGLKRGRGG